MNEKQFRILVEAIQKAIDSGRAGIDVTPYTALGIATHFVIDSGMEIRK